MTSARQVLRGNNRIEDDIGAFRSNTSCKFTQDDRLILTTHQHGDICLVRLHDNSGMD